jgi:hypothetical protein
MYMIRNITFFVYKKDIKIFSALRGVSIYHSFNSGAKIRQWCKNSPLLKTKTSFSKFSDALRRATSRSTRQIPLVRFHKIIWQDRPHAPKAARGMSVFGA